MASSVEEHPPLEPSESIHLPKPTFWPMVLGLGFMLVAFGVILIDQPLPTSGPPLRLTLGHTLIMGGVVVLLGAVGGWLWSNIRERVHAPQMVGVELPKFAMWCFLGTEVILFGALITRALTVWQEDRTAHDILNIPLTSLNTFALLASSLGVVLALSAIQRGDRLKLAGWLLVVILLGGFFLAVQAYEYNKLYHEGVTLSSSQFGSSFFLLTGFHGAHVFVGVIWCLVVLLRGLQGGFTAHDHMGVEVFGLYWHFVDVVWILIFTLVYLI
jgi:heme/copper-type cytochrome/quinol oxidase subunit 3